ncbi:serine/threonine protein kinase [Micromonospora zingiberis]|uniref:Serine/threonine protein kinase n=1 Tax=Micromonospora zingiberis TaxID=2053011 RepID=A0A4R0GS55_9ACTN|nr:serine/threonine-protein kinase [Micromonospora zingiberis]TCC00507.1 serine/threonine protein kinase [Micromonospora zingiberis]
MNQPLRPGDPVRLGDYHLLGRLGEGGMGEVFLARSGQGRQVAIKMIRPDFSDDHEFRARFRSEVNQARQVPPFCTAEVLDADPDHDPPYLVVEYVDGPSLAQVIRVQGPLGAGALHSMAVGVATALAAIHGAGVIHRDLKPGNVLVALGGIKVIDFGLARTFEATSQHTRTNQMVGTIAYMAPERFETGRNRTVGPAADIFAWGAMVAYAATGRNPFGADSGAAMAMRILSQPPDLTGLAGPLRGLVERALAKDPADRPTARTLLDELLVSAPSASAARTMLADAASALTLRAADPLASTMDGARAPGREGADPDRSPPRVPGRVFGGRTARRRNQLLVLTAVAVAAALAVPTFVFGPQLLSGLSGDAAPTSTGPARSGSSADLTSTGEGGPSATPSAGVTGILSGKRRTMLHIAEIDRNLSMNYRGEVRVGDGTGPEALFVLEPSGGSDYMIKSLNPEIDDPSCLGVKAQPDGLSTLVAADCVAGPATLFSVARAELFAIVPSGGVEDDQGRPTHVLHNGEHGFVQWSRSRKVIYLDAVGYGTLDTTFSLVDRGAL